MKKIITSISMMLFLSCLALAESGRFYEGGKVIDTMYVSSPDGLRVRNKASLNSDRICGLRYRFPVKVVAVGKEECIDGITDPWIQILLPAYQWSDPAVPEYGWVFGGYLSKVQGCFIPPRDKTELKEYLCSYVCWGKDAFHFHFEPNGQFWCGAHEKGEVTVGTYTVTGSSSVIITSRFLGLGDDDCTEETSCFNISDVTECSFTYDGPFFSYHKGETFQGTFWFDTDYEDGLFKNETIYRNYHKSIYEMFYDYQRKYFEKDLLYKYIMCGISADGTEYEEKYHEYWDPIMKIHQADVDAGHI